MTKPRDAQRQRVYDAEQATFLTRGSMILRANNGLGGTTNKVWSRVFETTADVQAYVDRIERSKWAARWFPEVMRRTHVIDAPQATRFARGGFGRIRLPGGSRGDRKWGHVEYIVLHEWAHNMTDDHDCAWHGPEFARVYVDAVERWIGNDAAVRLRAEFRKRGVRVATRRQAYPVAWELGAR